MAPATAAVSIASGRQSLRRTKREPPIRIAAGTTTTVDPSHVRSSIEDVSHPTRRATTREVMRGSARTLSS
jgi:hypothetical protein